MGTRGAYGFVQDGKYKVTYNHYDSYPSGLGKEIAEFLRGVVKEGQLDTLKERVKGLTLVNESKAVPKKLLKKYEAFYNPKVNTGKKDDWYCVMHGLQNGDILPHILEGSVEHMIDSSEFVKDSLFCEYAYIVDLNRDTFDIYIGFQHDPQEGNVFGTEKEGDYYPVKKLISFPLADIPSDWLEQVTKAEEKEQAIKEALEAEENGEEKE